jgi:hypothetical protein
VYQNFISYLYEAQHVSGDTPPIIRSLKLHWQPLVLHTWRVVGRVVVGRCQVEYTLLRYTLSDSVQQLHVQQPPTYAKPEAAGAVLGSWWWAVCRPKHVELYITIKYNFDTLLHLVGFFMWMISEYLIVTPHCAHWPIHKHNQCFCQHNCNLYYNQLLLHVSTTDKSRHMSVVCNTSCWFIAILWDPKLHVRMV